MSDIGDVGCWGLGTHDTQQAAGAGRRRCNCRACRVLASEQALAEPGRVVVPKVRKVETQGLVEQLAGSRGRLFCRDGAGEGGHD